MALALIKKHEQDAFVFTGEPLPPLPHKNSSNRDALEIAARWGCEMKQVNSNDVGVSHPLLIKDGRQGLAVSVGRRDASQALVSFLRKVRDATIQWHIDHAKPKLMQIAVMNNRPSSAPAPVLAGGIERPAASLPPAPILPKPEPSPRAFPYAETAKADLERRERTPLQECQRHFGSLSAMIHYREHCEGGSKWEPFGDCMEESCIRSRKHLDEMFKQDKRFRDLNEDIDSLLEQLDEAENKVKAMPAPVLAMAGEVKTYQTGGHPLLFGERLLIQPADDLETRKTKLDAQCNIFLAQLERVWLGGPRLFTMVGRALRATMAVRKFDPNFQTCFMTADLSMWKMTLLAVGEPGGQRKHLGNLGYAEMDTSCQILRDQLSKITAGRPLNSDGSASDSRTASA